MLLVCEYFLTYPISQCSMLKHFFVAFTVRVHELDYIVCRSAEYSRWKLSYWL